MFAACGFEVVVLTRIKKVAADNVHWAVWDGATPGDWTQELEGATAVINLAGHTINCPHTPTNRKLIVDSRVNSVRAITAAIRRCHRPPTVLVQSSAVGFYGDTGATPRDESSPSGVDFRAEACRAWEEALDPTTLPVTRCVTLRAGVVLGRDGGALPTLARLTRWFLGGAVGNGRQFISWIHQEDFNRIVCTAIENKHWSGTSTRQLRIPQPTPTSCANYATH
ncbi:MAG: NAD-dependent epimerase/dehydratase family protein [Verrucomicrobiota bacterium]